MDRSAELRLPTLAVPVRLALVGQDPRPAELFVADVARRGRSHLLDDLCAMLEARDEFVPVRMGGGVRLVGKRAIAWIAVRQRVAGEPPPPELPEELSDALTLYDRQHRVAIELLGGRAVEGLLLDSSPVDRSRVVDHLNRATAFLRVWTPEEHVLVGKQQIVSVTELPPAEPA